MSLGDMIQDGWEYVQQEVEEAGGWGDVALGAGMGLYNWMNPPEPESHRSIPPMRGQGGLLGPGAGGAGQWWAGGGAPGLTPIGQQITDLVTDPVGTVGSWFGEPGGQMSNGMLPSIPHASHPALFRPTRAGAVGNRVIPVVNPMTGRTHFFGDLGRPLLFSRDFAAHKRVNRLARKAARKR